MAAAYYTAPFKPDVTVVIDAIGEYDTASIWVEGQKFEQAISMVTRIIF